MSRLQTHAIFRAAVPSSIHKMGLLFFMYISQKVFLCFTWTLVPILLRRQGVSLGAIGFTALVYSPWALKFLYAGAVDRFHSPRWGRRKSWICPLLFLSVIILPMLCLLSPEKNLGLTLMTVFGMNLIFATTDIAVDGYATDILTDDERPWGNMVQMIAYMIGYMLGAGVFLIIYQAWGWRLTLMCIAALQTLFMIPIVTHREIPPVTREEVAGETLGSENGGTGGWTFIRGREIQWFLLFAAIIIVVDRGGGQLYLPLLADRGVDAIRLGQVNIWIGAPLSILGSILGGALLARLGLRRVFIIGCLGAAGLGFFSAAVSTLPRPGAWHIGILIGGDKLLVGILFVLIYSMVMRLSAGPRAASHYAILCSLAHLFGLVMMPIIGSICDKVGYVTLYSGLGVFGLLACFIGLRLLHGPLKIFVHVS